jgi:hypothetical protein
MGGLHVKHGSATQNLGTNIAFALTPRKNHGEPFSSYLKENTARFHEKDQCVNVVQESNRCVFSDSYEIHN